MFYQNELAIARAHQDWIFPIVDVGRHMFPTTSALAGNNIDQMLIHGLPNNILARMFLPSLPRSSQKFGYAQSSVDMARVACMLERYRLAQGEYPETLDALSPSFIEAVPHDVIGGQRLKYHRTDDGKFSLYSIGWNGMDDGGAVVFRTPLRLTIDFDKGDWVWTGQVITNSNPHPPNAAYSGCRAPGKSRQAIGEEEPEQLHQQAQPDSRAGNFPHVNADGRGQHGRERRAIEHVLERVRQQIQREEMPAGDVFKREQDEDERGDFQHPERQHRHRVGDEELQQRRQDQRNGKRE